MAYRNVYIQSGARITTRNSQLVIEQDGSVSIPIEDIRSVLVESQQCMLSSAAIAKLLNGGTVVIFCSDKHLPIGSLVPAHQYCRQLRQLRLQLGQSKPSQKRLWQHIVVAKIQNQARCLALCNYQTESQTLFDLAKRVASGDADNTEAVAAALYFKALFGTRFTRTQDCLINAALNYGYTIVRSFIARTLVVYGLEPALGIHHASELNNFNLADDIIEPFRQVVDLYVAQNADAWNEFSPRVKSSLFNLTNMEIRVKGQTVAVGYAIEQLIQSLLASFQTRHDELLLPELMAMQIHAYE